MSDWYKNGGGGHLTGCKAFKATRNQEKCAILHDNIVHLDFTFTFMQLVDAFVQCDLHCIQGAFNFQ